MSRPTRILLSDGVDVESLLQAAQVNEIAVRSQALVYWIRVSGEPFDLLQRSAWRGVAEHSSEIRQLAATVDAVRVIRTHAMPPGTEMASVFRVRRPSRARR